MIYKHNRTGDRAVFFTDPEGIEVQALDQIERLSRMPFIAPHLAVMPDVHLGKGACVGTVIPTEGALIPAAVGVDIGCGMLAQRVTATRAEFAGLEHAVRLEIEARVPCLGRMPVYNRAVLPSAQPHIAALEAYAEMHNVNPERYDGNWRLQLGSLGGGNHFIELVEDDRGEVWVFLHTGSRGVGNKMANFFIKKAGEFCRKAFISLPDGEQDLAYLPQSTDAFWQYVSAVNWAQDFANRNRLEILGRVLDAVQAHVPTAIPYGDMVKCHHNFTQRERHFGRELWVTRKGAIDAHEGIQGLIPGSMGTASYLVLGRGDRASLCSSPHGAGRNFSRTEARRRFTMEDMERQLGNVEARRDESLLDELPGAYKDIAAVMAYAEPLVAIQRKFTQFINVKGD